MSPLDKNGGSIDRDVLVQDFATSGAAEGGDAVAYASQSQFADPASGAAYSQYVSSRTGSGWVTRNISPPMQADDIEPSTLTNPMIQYLSADLTSAVVGTNALLTPGATKLGGSWGLYRWGAHEPAYRLLTDPWTTLPPDESGEAFARFVFEGASRDMNHIVFSSFRRQLTEDGLTLTMVYKWSPDGVRLVSKMPNGDLALFPFAGARSVQAHGVDFPGERLISNDGFRVFFSADAAVFVREGDDRTVPISTSEREGDDPTIPLQGTFEAGAAEHGNRALFSSALPLTDDSTSEVGVADLYLWQRDLPEGSRLRNLTSVGVGGAAVEAVVGSNDDLTRAYFVARGALTDGAIAGGYNLYEWHDGEGLRLVAVLDATDNAVWTVRRLSLQDRFRDARVDGDGTRLVFTSVAKLTDYDNMGTRQVYLYDSLTGELTCVSCDPAGRDPQASSGLFPVVTGEVLSTPYRLPRNLSADGSTVIFETAQGLVREDSNGKADVYAWVEGHLSLISSGKSTDDSQFVDASADARDVFFTTSERLVRSDTDNQRDLYDARIGGGFADPPVTVPCADDACQGESSVPPMLASPLTATFAGKGNVRANPPKRPRKAQRCVPRRQGRGLRVRRCARQRCKAKKVERKRVKRCARGRGAVIKNGRS